MITQVLKANKMFLPANLNPFTRQHRQSVEPANAAEAIGNKWGVQFQNPHDFGLLTGVVIGMKWHNKIQYALVKCENKHFPVWVNDYDFIAWITPEAIAAATAA